MRRSFCSIALSGMLLATAPAAAVAVPGSVADASCGKDFRERLQCWSRNIGDGAVRVTLDEPVRFDGSAQERRAVEGALWRDRANLVVEVPKSRHTGGGGTALLLLANATGRLVEQDATIDRLPAEAVSELTNLQACRPKNPKDLCARLAKGPLRGADLIAEHLAADLSEHTYAIAGPSGPPFGGTGTPSGTSRNTEKADGKQSSGAGKGAEKGADKASDQASDAGWDTATQILAVLCVLLVVLLAALLFLIRRSSRAVGTLSRRALAAPGVGAVPPTTAPTRRRDETTVRPRDETTTRPRDETTTRLRVTPTPRYGRRVGNVPGPARSAVVRTELHPQGYVEIDRVLYRAVWAEPGRPPPAPGGLVDVTDARERDSDVLYAFPRATGRHANGTRT
ncbi:hypothetical protein BKI49_23315 [Streptomyces sp. Tue6028]|uniref:hypothetical protein n=1 Tax=Streptomyces sp. Tue6028 TaxID=2036037 RepID=UPI000BC7A555|nr:hypothetical protein [Streptomyces sp. Tue6028]PBC61916.1 hypothetical protein BKI49_23315 [Streptomyces sp. Tue6028]